MLRPDGVADNEKWVAMDPNPETEKDVANKWDVLMSCHHAMDMDGVTTRSQHLRIVGNRSGAALQGSCHGCKGTGFVSLPLAFTAHQLTRAPIRRRFLRLSQNAACVPDRSFVRIGCRRPGSE